MNRRDRRRDRRYKNKKKKLQPDARRNDATRIEPTTTCGWAHRRLPDPTTRRHDDAATADAGAQ
jgi:hypothetical protein